jgi:hypothetical protein
MPHSYIDRIDSASRRFDIAADVAVEKARRELREMKRADALDAEERREQARKDRARCIAHQATYEERFARHGVKAPAAVADDTGPGYRRRLFGIAQTLLPDGHALTKFDARDIDGSAIVPMEQSLFDALDREAENPSGSNLPESPDDPRARREVADSVGAKKTEYHAKRSFIADLNRNGRKVARIIDAPRGRVIWGAQFPHTPT